MRSLLLQLTLNNVLSKKDKLQWLFVWFALIGFVESSIAQNAASQHHFQRYDHKDGLPSDNVSVSFCDRDGFLWVGTTKGLSRFDGMHFLNFPNVGFEGKKEITASVLSIAQDENGMLWLAHTEGISRFDPHRFTFKYYNPQQNIFPDHHHVRGVQIVFHPEVGLLAATYHGFCVYRPEVDTFQVFVAKAGDSLLLHDSRIWFRSLLHCPDLGGCFVGAGGGQCFFNYKTQTFTNCLNNPLKWAIFELKNVSTLTAFYRDKEGLIWFSTRYKGIISRFDPQKNTVTVYPINKKSSSSEDLQHCLTIEEVENGKLWLGMGSGGILIFDKATGRTESLKEQSSGETTPSVAHRCQHLYKSPKGDYWISNTDGLYRKKNLPTWLQSYDCPIFNRANINIPAFFDANNQLWLRPSYYEWVNMDLKTGKTRTIQPVHRDSIARLSYYVKTFNGFPKPFLWLNSEDGPQLFDPSVNRFLDWKNRFPTLWKENQKHHLSFMSQTNDGQFWTRSNDMKDFFLYDNQKDHILRVEPLKNLTTLNIRTVLTDKEGIHWFCFGGEIGRAHV